VDAFGSRTFFDGKRMRPLGQIRTNDFLADPWALNEFHLKMVCDEAGDCKHKMVSSVVADTVRPTLFQRLNDDGTVNKDADAFLQEVFLPALATPESGLRINDLNRFDANIPVRFLDIAADSQTLGSPGTGDYGFYLQQEELNDTTDQEIDTAWDFIESALTGTGLTPLDAASRFKNLSCHGCHAPGEGSGGSDMGSRIDFAGSLGFAHVKRDVIVQPGGTFEMSSGITQRFLPFRRERLKSFACGSFAPVYTNEFDEPEDTGDWSPAGGNWSIDGGAFVQTENAPDAMQILKVQGSADWTNYVVQMGFKTDDDDRIGVAFFVNDDQNLYRFWVRPQTQTARLERVRNGAVEILVEQPFTADLSGSNTLLVNAGEDVVSVTLNGVKIVSEFFITDDNPQGGIGLYTWYNEGSRFEAVRIFQNSSLPALNKTAFIEAESYGKGTMLNPFSVQREIGASGSQVVRWSAPFGESNHHKNPTEEDAGQLVYPFLMENPADVTLFARVAFPTNVDDSFYYKFDDEEDWQTFNNRQTIDFEWLRITSRDALQPGLHRLRIMRREDGAALDAFFLSTGGQAPPQTAQ
jgi:hypothetical protein